MLAAPRGTRTAFSCGTFSGILRPKLRISSLFSVSYENSMAEREGFEPSLELPLNTLSKRAP